MQNKIPPIKNDFHDVTSGGEEWLKSVIILFYFHLLHEDVRLDGFTPKPKDIMQELKGKKNGAYAPSESWNLI